MNDSPLAYFDSNNGTALLGFGNGDSLLLYPSMVFEPLDAFLQKHQGKYIFLLLSYDLKNEIEVLTSKNTDGIKFPLAILWAPEKVVSISGTTSTFVQGNPGPQDEKKLNAFFTLRNQTNYAPLHHTLSPRTSKSEYLKHIRALQQEIQQGNIYEVNYCQEFFARDMELSNPLEAFFKLNSITKAPYASFFSFNEFSVMSGSPERFIQKKGNQLISSPIKGTKKRGHSPEEDEALKQELLNDPKERSENVMIVDLVRNDLSKIAMKNSVHVDELFGIYTFETVHQMISTISCTLKENTSFSEILKATFPMGSMTGAPKIRAMQLIEQHEDFKRGIYSGSMGYIKPNGDFDFNVVIRSLVYNQKERYLSCSVGGAITINSVPEKEYEECETKIQRILDGMNA